MSYDGPFNRGWSWQGNESIRDEFHDLDPGQRTDVPVLGSRATMDYSTIAHKLQVAEYQASDYRRLLRVAERQRDAVKQKNAELTKALEKMFDATGGLTVDFQIQGNFTICVLVDPISERVFAGAACCNAEDTFSSEIGKAISLGRAMNSRAEYFANAAFAR